MPRIALPGTLSTFFSKVEKTDGCWLWTGAKAPNGQGRFYEGKTDDGRSKVTAAHRWLYEQVVGPIPPKHRVEPICQTPNCVRPAHLDVASLRRPDEPGGSGRSKRHGLVSEDDFDAWALRTARKITVSAEGCWIWDRGVDSGGYGRLGIPQPGGAYKTVRAMRWFYEQFVGEIPKGMTLAPVCGDRLCVSPEHLRVLDHGEHVSLAWRLKRESRTHCKHGHALAEVGTTSKGDCRQCNRDKVARHRAKKLAEQREG